MKGVWSWADHIQAIQSGHPITEPHPMVYQTVRSASQQILTNKILADVK